MAVTLISKPKLHKKCIRCDHALSKKESQERGYGDVCWAKLGNGLVSKRQTHIMKEQLHARATATQIEELSAKLYSLIDVVEQLKTLRVTHPIAPPSIIPTPSDMNIPLEKVVQPDASQTPQNGHELNLGTQVTIADLADALPAIQSEIAELMEARKAELDRTASKSIGRNTEVKDEQTNGSLESLVVLQEKIKGV